MPGVTGDVMDSNLSITEIYMAAPAMMMNRVQTSSAVDRVPEDSACLTTTDRDRSLSVRVSAAHSLRHVAQHTEHARRATGSVASDMAQKIADVAHGISHNDLAHWIISQRENPLPEKDEDCPKEMLDASNAAVRSLLA